MGANPNTPSDFMARVVPWPGDEPGYINIHTFRADRKDPKTGKEHIYGKAFRTLPELMGYVQYCAANPGKHSAIYFCTSTQASQNTKGKFPSALRNRPNAKWLKAIWLDIDTGKKGSYATINEALDAINAFKLAAAIPAPTALVATGGGLHVYWISDKRLTRDEWQSYADGLKEEAQKFGLKADLQCTADAARILRVPGTFNTKYGQPRPCKVLHLGDDIDFAKDLAHIKRAVTATVTRAAPTAADPGFSVEGWKPVASFGHLTDSLAEGIDKREKLPIDPRPMFTQCQHFRNTLKTGGKNDPEPLWMLNLLACTFVENGENIAHMLSNGYPTYDREETDKKLAERFRYKAEKDLGWPACTQYEGSGANCKGCPLRGTIRSPLNLCTPVAPPPPPPPQQPQDLPNGYVFDEDGIICQIVSKKVGQEYVEDIAPLFMSLMRNWNTGKDAGRPVLTVDVNLDMDKWRKATIYETDLATEQRMAFACRREGMKPFTPNQGKIGHFMTSFWAKLDREKYRAHTIPFGWMMDPAGGKIPIGFAYGGKVFLPDGTEQEAGAADPQFGPLYMPKGDPQSRDWWSLHDMVVAQHHPALEALVAVAFGAPLIIGAGQYNAFVCGWSPEAGSHKSTSMHIGAAVWGEPKKTKEKPNATMKGLMRKAGETRNLPLYWDEISDDKKMNYVRGMIGDMTEGSLGTRLRQDRTAYMYDEWQTILSVCANKSLTNNILAHVKDTDAQLERVFEFQVEKRGDTMRPHEVSLLVNSLDYNYGYIGLKYAKVLGGDPKGVMDFMEKVVGRFIEDVGASSTARFRCAVAATIWAGAALANKHIGTKFNLDELWDYLKSEFNKQHLTISKAEIVAGQRSNTINTMTQFFKTVTRNTLWVERMPVVSGRGRPWAVTRQAGPSPERPDPIHVRCAVTNRVIEISKQRLYEFFSATEGTNASATLLSLKNHFGAEEFPRLDLSYGAGVGGGRETVMSIPVPDNSPFAGILFKHTPPDQRPPGVIIDDDFSQDASHAQDTPTATNGAGEATAPGASAVHVQGGTQGTAEGVDAGVPGILGVGEGVETGLVTATVTASEDTERSSSPTELPAKTADSQPE